MAAACVYPFINTLAVSLSDGAMAAAGKVYLWPRNFNVESYTYILGNRQIGVFRGLYNSFIYTFFGTIVAVCATFLGAYCLSRKRFVGRNIFMMGIFFTMLFSGGLIPTYLLMNQLNLLNTVWVIIIPGCIDVFLLIITRTFLDAQPIELEECAFMDGANDFKIMYKIFLPLSMPIIATIGVFYAINIWNSYLGPLIYLRDPAKYPIQVLMAQLVIKGSGGTTTLAAQEQNGYMIYPKNLKAAIIFLGMFPILLIYPYAQKYFTKGIMIGAIKG